MNQDSIAPEVDPGRLITDQNLERAREAAFAALLSPVFYMASLSTACLMLLKVFSTAAPLYVFWLMGHCLICSILLLVSMREGEAFLDEDNFARTGVHSPVRVALGVLWGVAPILLALIEPASPVFLFGLMVAGLCMAATLMLDYIPQAGRILLAFGVGGFLAYAAMQPTLGESLTNIALLVYFCGLSIFARRYFRRFDLRLKDNQVSAERVRQINGVLRDVGFATHTFFWRTNAENQIVEITHEDRFGDVLKAAIIGRDVTSLFKPSQERELLRSRIKRGSEVVALELEVDDHIPTETEYWKLSARPVFEDGEFVGYRGATTDVSELRESESRAAFLNEYDRLTGLLNRASFSDALKMHIQVMTSDTHETGLIWIDLDNFKWINDTFGHAGGDEVLCLVARRLERHCEPLDVICRYGGDEFAMLVTRARQGDKMRQFIETLTQALQKPYKVSDTDVQCGASVGLRRINPSERDASALMREADLALYAAKSSGRGIWREYSESFKAKVRGQRELAQDLRSAIEADELNLQFQPIVDAHTGAICGVEALSRWYHPTRGAVSPSEFIPIAEDNGLIIELGDRVVVNTIAAAVDMPEEVRVGLNVSPLQLHSSQLLSLIEETLEKTGIEPGRIELEITESVFLSDNVFILGRLRRLKELGLRIALDDFGTGFSSLAYLQRFPFDKLKLDQAFVSGIENSDQSCAIARATISMAHALGLTVTAEGVESEAQANFLREQGCDELQGFLFSRPQDRAAIGPYLRSMRLLNETRSKVVGENIVSLAKRG